jgi:hypothetical protein
MIALRKQKVTAHSYLFIKQLVSPEYEVSEDEEIRKLTSPLINQIYRSVVEKAGKNTGLNKWNYIRAHSVRKYFNSALLNAGADSFFSEFLMGHKLDQTQEAYFQAQPEKLKETYKKYIPFLTIQKALDISESDEYKNIKNENDILRAETARHIVERKEIQEARKMIASIRHSMTPRPEKFKNEEERRIFEELNKTETVTHSSIKLLKILWGCDSEENNS